MEGGVLFTKIVKFVEPTPPLMSVTVTFTQHSPTSSFSGVPERLPVMGSIISQDALVTSPHVTIRSSTSMKS